MTELPRQAIGRAELAQALEHASIPTLLPVLVQLTGDRSWIEPPYTVERVRGLVENPSGGLAPELQAKVREAALDAVLEWHAGRPAAMSRPDRDTLRALMSAAIGQPARIEYADIFAADLAIDESVDGRVEESPSEAVPGEQRLIETDVVVVGAGFSGLRAGIEFQERGIPFTIIERNSDVGGVWLTSNYPGAGVDTPTQLYSLATDPYPWSGVFARQPEMLDYARSVAERHALHESIRFGTEVTSAVWDDEGERWRIELRIPDGGTEVLTPRVLVSAVGTFATAAMPAMPGIDDFAGEVIHTAQWPEGVDLRGKRVAVIGAGASAMQLVPAIVDQVDELVLFQRTPQWIAPVEDYFEQFPPEIDQLNRWVPSYREWWRFRLATIWNDGAFPALLVEEGWEEFPRSVNRVNASQRRYYERYLRQQLEGRDDLIEISLPDYPPFAKRLLLDNGWFAAIRKDHVRVVPRGVSAIRPHAVVAEDAEEHEVDIVIFATGYSATEYLATLPVTGPGGVRLGDAWNKDDASAYLGMTVPGFPNLFIMYGPNTHPGPGGSYLFIAEVSAGYIADAVEFLEEQGGGTLAVRPEILQEYQAEVDSMNAGMVWGTDLVRSYVKNSAGRVVIFLPWRISDYWLLAHQFLPEDFRVESRVSAR
ncbi:NAD(P)-binding domain-containing protein [Microbacterium sp. LWH7-1.2]|uniref:NAD(P)-binding domain-containing protein n=1 Tax=Microbacterium sp. LWH7-1.2 TaxID=3135257 RepID=UPI0031393D65